MAIVIVLIIGMFVAVATWMGVRSQRAPIYLSEPLDIGRVLGEAFDAFRILGWPMVPLAIVIVGLPHLAQAYIDRVILSPEVRVGAISPLRMFGWTSVGLFAVSFSAIIFRIPATVILVARYEARSVEGRVALGTMLRFLFPLLALSIVETAGVAAGVVAFIVPGIVLMLSWAVAHPALLVERTTILGALSRSRELTVGSRGRILITMILVGVMGGGLELSGGWFIRHLGAPPWASALWTGLISVPLAIFGAGYGAALYVELRRIKEGIASPGLAEVFA